MKSAASCCAANSMRRTSTSTASNVCYGVDEDSGDLPHRQKRKDEQAHGEYRTKRVILDIYDAMQQAMETGMPYHTRLDPPPAHGWTPPESHVGSGDSTTGR